MVIPRDMFSYPTLKQIMDSFSCLTIEYHIFYFKVSSQVPEYAEIQCHLMMSLCHNIDVS